MSDASGSEGSVLSILIPPWVSEAVFPALSVQVPIADWPAPSVVTVWLALAETTPESAAGRDPLTVTLVLFQPLALGVVRLANVMIGLVLSSLIVTEAEFERPTPSVAEQVRVAPVVSLVRFDAVQPLEEKIPDSASENAQLTDTSLEYQPLLPEVPLTLGLMTGGVVSGA